MTVRLGLFSTPRLLVAATSAVLLALIMGAAVCAGEVNNKLVSRASGENGQIGNGESVRPELTPDGVFVVFESEASNLIPGVSGRQVYLRNLQTNQIELISKNTSGGPGNGQSYQAHISSDGRYVSFTSRATDLVANDTNGLDDIFVRDRQSNTTTRVSVPLTGGEANNTSFRSRLSGDGRFVLFESRASNLVANDTNSMSDGFLLDRQGSTLERVTLSDTGAQLSGANGGRNEAPSISDDGRYIVFQTDPGVTNAVASDTNNAQDVFLRDRQTSTTTRLSANGSGIEGNNSSQFPFISRDGSTIVFTSFANNLVATDTNDNADVFVYKVATGNLTRITDGNGDASQATVSSNGRFIAFSSQASNVVSDDNNNFFDQFIHDTQSGLTTMLSRASDGTPGNGPSGSQSLPGQPTIFCCYAVVSTDGRLVAYDSQASNLVFDDTNNTGDVFIHDRAPNIIARAGDDQNVVEGQVVTLNGNTSTGNNLTFAWEQLSGPTIVNPQGASTSNFSFTAPSVNGTGLVVIRLVVQDTSGASSFDTVNINVQGSGSGPVDSDGDGFDDQTEINAGTNPNDPLSFPGSTSTGDFDNDGINDWLDFDDDNDGALDVDEISSGTDPRNANSFPAIILPSAPLRVSKVQAKINFTAQGKDTFAVIGSADNLPAGFSLANQSIIFYVGGEKKAVVLSSKGKSPDKNFSVKAKLKPTVNRAFAGGTGVFTVTVKKTTLMSAIGVPNQTATNSAFPVPMILAIGNFRFTAVPAVQLTSKQGKTATLKFKQ